MAKRPLNENGDRDSKRAKISNGDTIDPRSNPYLAHMYDDDSGGVPLYFPPSSQASSRLSSFKRHNTTSEQARKAEDGPDNPFTGLPLSDQYFKILKTRRDLPVHLQRDQFLKLYQS